MNNKQAAVIKKYEEILGRNKYSQPKRDYCYKKHSDGNYYSDCSSSISYAYKEAGFSFGILNTVGMYQSEKLEDVAVEIKNGIIQNPEILEYGDVLLFAGTDNSRKYADCVGHVEMVGNINGGKVILYGHGSGTPRDTEMNAYCKKRFAQKTNTVIGNKGLLKVRRFPALFEGEKSEIEVPSTIDAVMITGGTVNIRSKPDVSSRKLGLERRGALLPARDVASRNGFVGVQYKGVDAWVSAKYCKSTAKKQYVKIFDGNCYIRTQPNTDGRILGTAMRESKHVYAGEVAANGWLKIRYENKEGWVSDKYAKLVEE